MHAWDMAAVTGEKTGADAAAEAVLAQLMPVWPKFFRSDLGDDVTIELSPTGMSPQVLTFSGGRVKAEPSKPGATYSCSVRGSAMGFLLVIHRRLDAAGAELAVSGDRPDLVQRFGWPSL
jgi:hypothetical protein